jgi:hypothetical protein
MQAFKLIAHERQPALENFAHVIKKSLQMAPTRWIAGCALRDAGV